jgi:glutathione S-transferase
MMIERMFPAIGNRSNCPRLLDWVARMRARPGVAKALAGPDRTNPALRTFTGEVH